MKLHRPKKAVQCAKSAIGRRRETERGFGFQRPWNSIARFWGVIGRGAFVEVKALKRLCFSRKIGSAGKPPPLPFPVILRLAPRIGGSTRRKEASGGDSTLRRILGSNPEMRGIDRYRQSGSLALKADIPKVGLGWEADITSGLGARYPLLPRHRRRAPL